MTNEVEGDTRLFRFQLLDTDEKSRAARLSLFDQIAIRAKAKQPGVVYPVSLDFARYLLAGIGGEVHTVDWGELGAAMTLVMHALMWAHLDEQSIDSVIAGLANVISEPKKKPIAPSALCCRAYEGAVFGLLRERKCNVAWNTTKAPGQSDLSFRILLPSGLTEDHSDPSFWVERSLSIECYFPQIIYNGDPEKYGRTIGTRIFNKYRQNVDRVESSDRNGETPYQEQLVFANISRGLLPKGETWTSDEWENYAKFFRGLYHMEGLGQVKEHLSVLLTSWFSPTPELISLKTSPFLDLLWPVIPTIEGVSMNMAKAVLLSQIFGSESGNANLYEMSDKIIQYVQGEHGPELHKPHVDRDSPLTDYLRPGATPECLE